MERPTSRSPSIPPSYQPAGYVAGSDLPNNGVTFQLTSNASGQDFFDFPQKLTDTVDLANVTQVNLLVGSYAVVAGSHGNLNVWFGAANGTTEFFSNLPILDFNDVNNTTENQSFTMAGSATPNVFDQTVFEVNDKGAGGTGNSATGRTGVYDLTELTFDLNNTFTTSDLTSINFQGSAYTPFLLAITADTGTSAVATSPEPSTWACACAGLMILAVGLTKRRKVPVR